MSNPSPSLDITIRTKAELAGAEAAAQSLEKQIGQAKVLGKEYAHLEEKLKKAQSAIADFKKSNPDQDRPGDGLPPWMANMGGKIAGLASLATVLKLAKDSLAGYAEAERNVNSLDATLAQRSLLTNAFRDSLHSLASELEGQTKIADDNWLSAISEQLMHGADESNISAVMEGVKNLAGIMKGDVAQASKAMALAMEGNVEALKRYGIHVGEAGSKSEKFHMALEQINSMGKGQLEAMAGGVEGLQKSFGNAYDKVTQLFGSLVFGKGIIRDHVDLAASAFQGLANAMDVNIQRAPGLHNALNATRKSLDDAIVSASSFKKEVEAIQKASEAAATALDRINQAAQKQKSHAQQMADTRLEYDLARLKEAKDRGMMPESVYKLREYQLRRGHAKESYELDKKAAQDEINRNNKEMTDAQAQAKAYAEMEGLQQAALQNAEQYEGAKQRRSNIKRELILMQEDLAQARGAKSEQVYTAGGAFPALPPGQADQRINEILERIAQLEQQKAAEEGNILKYGAKVPKGLNASQIRRDLTQTQAEGAVVKDNAAKVIDQLGYKNQGLHQDLKNMAEQWAAKNSLEAYKAAEGIGVALTRNQAQWMGAFRDINGKVDALTKEMAILTSRMKNLRYP